jgi:hypothetical protein
MTALGRFDFSPTVSERRRSRANLPFGAAEADRGVGVETRHSFDASDIALLTHERHQNSKGRNGDHADDDDRGGEPSKPPSIAALSLVGAKR